jgi:glycosyltransferase involved in cell wall biosynthesis
MEQLSRSEVTFGQRGLFERSIVPPRVTVVIVNRNYAAFVGDAIKSVRDQTYTWFDCLILDNDSDDESRTVIRRHIGDDPRFTVIESSRNLGHIGAALSVFDRIAGEFVVFLDADDVLFPGYIAAHVQTHLALTQAVALTTSNIVEIDRDGHMLSGGCWWLKVDRPQGGSGFRALRSVPRLACVSDNDYDLLGAASGIIPWSTPGWNWAPGSATMYRRSALGLIKPACEDGAMFGGVDAYFNSFAHVLTGTGVIDMPLSAYRIHGGNSFSLRPMLWGIRTGSAEALAAARNVRRVLVATVIERADQLGWIMTADRFWASLDLLYPHTEPPLADFYASLTEVFAENYHRLAAAFGERRVLSELRRRLRHRDFRRMIRKAYASGVPLATRRLALGIEVRRHVGRMRSRLAAP